MMFLPRTLPVATMALATIALAAFAVLTPGLLAAESTGLSIDAPYARAVPPGQPNSAVFMVMTNEGDTPRALVAAESDAATTVELHTHRLEDGMMKMRRIERIELPAGERVELKPGGLHVMLIGLAEQLKPGMEVQLTLVFDDDSREEITAPVRRIDASMHGRAQGAH
jgi:copper(I)-binding protein